MAAMLGVLSVGTLALRRPSRSLTLSTRRAASPLVTLAGRRRRVQSSKEQRKADELAKVAKYAERGLDSHVARLLSSPEIPRGELAAWATILGMKAESERMGVEMKLSQKEVLLREVTRKYMQLTKLWHPRGILDLAEQGVYLLPLGMQLGAPVLSNRVAKWTYLMDRFKSLRSHICSSTGWEATEIPQRIEAMYKQLPGHDANAFYDMVVMQIEEGPLDKEQMAALACVAEFYAIDYELRYTREPAKTKPTDK